LPVLDHDLRFCPMCGKLGLEAFSVKQYRTVKRERRRYAYGRFLHFEDGKIASCHLLGSQRS
jgi:hypothetical protein